MRLSNAPARSTASPERQSQVKVVLVYSPSARDVREWVLELADGSTVGSALEHATVLAEFPGLNLEALQPGIWGRQCGPDHMLKDKDRVEIYRRLRVDPKVARRERFNKQGSKGTGLFAANRPGSKAGY